MQVMDLEETLYQPDKQLVMVATEIGGDACPVGTLNWILHTQTLLYSSYSDTRPTLYTQSSGHCFTVTRSLFYTTVHTQTPGQHFTVTRSLLYMDTRSLFYSSYSDTRPSLYTQSPGHCFTVQTLPPDHYFSV